MNGSKTHGLPAGLPLALALALAACDGGAEHADPDPVAGVPSAPRGADADGSDDPFAGLNLGGGGAEGGAVAEPELSQKEWAYKDQYVVQRYEDERGQDERENTGKAEPTAIGHGSAGEAHRRTGDDEMFDLEAQVPPKDPRPPPGFKKPDVQLNGDIKKPRSGKPRVVDPWKGQERPVPPRPDPELNKASPAARLHGREPSR